MAIRESITMKEAIDFLNSLVAKDADAVTTLIEQRVPCNQAMADHPTVQCLLTDNGGKVGLLGILNGLFGSNDQGWGAIAAVMEFRCPECKYLPSLDAPVKEGDPCPNCGKGRFVPQVLLFQRTVEALRGSSKLGLE